MAELFAGRRLYGAALYPEAWEPEVFAADVATMARLGMNTARLGEFMWSTLEPNRDAIDLSVVHEALELLARHDIAAILCTPTVTPPIWLSHGHPERLHHTSAGVPLGHGSRQHLCTNNTEFRARAAHITAALAQAFGNDSRVLAWQLDNEFKSHVGGCHCLTCRALWSTWLQRSFREVGELNRRWSTAIWSETYQSWEQVPLPGPTPFLHNTSLLQAFRQFSQDMVNDFAHEQAAIIRGHSAHPITHNSGFGFDLDNTGLFGGLDFSSFDTYPAAENYPAFLMNLDYFPHFGATGRTMLMETSTSHGGSVASYGIAHPEGFVAAEIFANFASDSRGFLFWPFRQQRGGSEQPHGAVVSPWGAPTIGYRAAAAGGALLQQLTPLLAASEAVPVLTAITYSDRAKAFTQTETGGGLDYRGALSAVHRRLLSAGLRRDLVPETAPLDGYRLLFTPFMHHLSASFLARVADWVRAGGTWVVGPGSGDRTEDHGWPSDSALGALEELAGVRGGYQFPVSGSQSSGRTGDWEGILTGMATFVETVAARPLGTVLSGPAAGQVFLSEHSGTPVTGSGRVIYVGAAPELDDPDDFLGTLIDYASTVALPPEERFAGRGVVEYRRHRAGHTQHWLLNFTNQPGEVTLARPAIDLLSNTHLAAGTHRLDAYTYIIAEETSA